MVGTLQAVGANSQVIWEFGAGVLGIYLLASILVMGVEAIRRFLNQA